MDELESDIKKVEVHRAIGGCVWIYAKPTRKMWRYSTDPDMYGFEYAVCPYCYAMKILNKDNWKYEPMEWHIGKMDAPLDFIKGFFDYFLTKKKVVKNGLWTFSVYKWFQIFQIKDL